MLHELRASGVGGDLSYWRTPSGTEVDFVWQKGERRVGIEVKASQTWRSRDGAGLRALAEEVGLDRSLALYRGDVARRDGAIEVLPLHRFLDDVAGWLTGTAPRMQ